MSYLWAKIIKVLNNLNLIFQKTWIKDCFKLFILDFDICLHLPTITTSKKFLFLNGISIVVVINSWLKQYVINLAKLVHA